MTPERIAQIVIEEWDSQAYCASCGWHAAPYEYDFSEDVYVNEEEGRIELPCRGDDENSAYHRGVRIYY